MCVGTNIWTCKVHACDAKNKNKRLNAEDVAEDEEGASADLRLNHRSKAAIAAEERKATSHRMAEGERAADLKVKGKLGGRSSQEVNVEDQSDRTKLILNVGLRVEVTAKLVRLKVG